MKNIPFPNPHDADALNDHLDALANGTRPAAADDVQAAANEFHRLAITARYVEGPKKMSTTALIAPAAPVSNRTRRQREDVRRTPSRWNAWVSSALVAALLVAVMGYGLWNGSGRNDNNLAWAPQTASPMAEDPFTPETAPWIADFTTDDCRRTSDLQQVEIDYSTLPESEPQGYRVIGPADRTDAASVSSQYRAMRGCFDLSSAWAYWSKARIYEYPRALNEVNQAELVEMQQYFRSVYPQQFMAVAEGLQVGPDIRQEWEARLQSNMLGQPIPLGAKLNPAWAVELSDGRIAIPATFMYSVNDPAIMASGLPTEYPASTVVIIFTLEEGDWKYDDSLMMCIVNCASGMGNPLDPEVATWSAPYEIETCTGSEGSVGTDQPDTVMSTPAAGDNSYTSAGTPDPAVLRESIPGLYELASCAEIQNESVTDAGRISYSEMVMPGSQQRDELVPFFIQSERGGTMIIVDNPQLSQIEVVDAEIYRPTIAGMTPTLFFAGNGENIARTKYQFSRFDPDRAILLEDGRVALTTTVLLSNRDRGAISYEGDPELWPMPILILKNVEGNMLIDEVISRPRYVGLVTPSYSWWWDSRLIPTVAPTSAATPEE